MTQQLEKLTPLQMWPHCAKCRELDDYCSPECERVIFEKEVCIHGNPFLEPCAECNSRWPSGA